MKLRSWGFLSKTLVGKLSPRSCFHMQRCMGTGGLEQSDKQELVDCRLPRRSHVPNRTDHLISVSPTFQICFCEIMAKSEYWAAWVERRSQCQCNMTAETCSDSWKMMAAGKDELRGQPTLLRTIGEGLTLATASLSCLDSWPRFSGEILLRKPKFVHYP